MGEFEIFGMPVSLGTMIFQAVIFTALIWILKQKFLSKLVGAMESRRESIDNQLNLAETYKHEAEAELLKQREMTEKATQDAKQIIAKAREEANIIVKAARKEAFTIRTEAYENERRALKGRGAS
ncbi:ATP synthase F0 subunit B [Bacillus sp. FJAT-29814]|uniref:F0F1 ATP synthase subunit B family protein n=1 Tax=Bacillus sp. FJAT-29814 TaxID=1729688 RepID=UPI00082F90AF|nr:ATP synthase F0 subunit B [Bacillus sp. FJAT-29814]